MSAGRGITITAIGAVGAAGIGRRRLRPAGAPGIRVGIAAASILAARAFGPGVRMPAPVILAAPAFGPVIRAVRTLARVMLAVPALVPLQAVPATARARLTVATPAAAVRARMVAGTVVTGTTIAANA